MPKHHNLFFALTKKSNAIPSLYGVCYTTPALNNTLTVQIHCIPCLCHVASLLDRCCNLQGSQTVNAQTIQDLALSPLHDTISPRILALTCRLRAFPKPLIAIAFRFITRPLRCPGVLCPAVTGLFSALPLQCKLFLALPSLRNSDPFRHTAQLYLANAHQFISKTKLVKSQPEQFKTKPLQVATLRHHI